MTSNFFSANFVCIFLTLFAKTSAHFWNGAKSVTVSNFINITPGSFQSIGLDLTANVTAADQHVYLMTTLSYRASSDGSQMRFTIYRNGVAFSSKPMLSIDASKEGEQYPVTFTYIDSPGAVAIFTYAVVVDGEGEISFSNSKRTLFCNVGVSGYPMAGTTDNSVVAVTSTTSVPLNSVSYTRSVSGGHLIGATSVFVPTVGSFSETGFFSLTRDGADISGGPGFLFPDSSVAQRRRLVSMLYLHTPEAEEGATTFTATARLGQPGHASYNVGASSGESHMLTTIAMPPNMGYATTITESFTANTSSTAWTDIGLSVAVPGAMQASRVLVTVHTFVRSLSDVSNSVTRFAIFRNGVNLGDVASGLQTVVCVAGGGVKYVAAPFFFLDNIPGSTSADLVYTLMVKVDGGSGSGISIGQSSVKSQIAAIVVEGCGGGGDSEVSPPTMEPSALLASQPFGNPVVSHLGSHMGVLSTPTNPPTTSGSNLGLPHFTTATSAVTLPGGTTYTSIGLSLSPVITTSTDKVFLLATLNWRATAATDTLLLNFFRNGVQLAPVALAASDAMRANEHYPITIAFRDMPGATGTVNYEVRAAGSGIISHDGNPRTLLAFIVAAAHPATAVYTSGAQSITSTSPTSLGMTASVSLPATTPVLLLTSSTFTPLGLPIGSNYGSYTFARNGAGLAGVLTLPGSNVAHERSAVVMCYLHLAAPAGTGSYTVTGKKGHSGVNTFTVGSGGETRNLVALPLPAGKSYVGQTISNTQVSSSAWTNVVGLTVTVPSSVSATRVLLNVQMYTRSSVYTSTTTGHYTIFRNGINLGDPSSGLQTVAFVSQSPDNINRDTSFFFQDFPPADGSSLVYTVRARVTLGAFSASEYSVTSQIGASVLEAAPAMPPPTAVPTAAPTSISPDLSFFMTSPTYIISPGFAFAARNPITGAAWTWGQLSAASSTLNVATTMQSGTSSLVGNKAAFAFTKSDGSLGAFGVGALIDRHTAYAAASSANLVGSLVSNEAAFAGIQSGTGRVIAFGSYYNGGDVSTNARCNGYATQLSSGVVSIVASSAAFAAVKSDGRVYAWGNKFAGGGVSTETRPDLVGVTKVFATATAFAALLASGAVKTWGGEYGGGDSSAVASALSSGVVHIVGSHSVFVAYKADTSIVVWGNPEYGGSVTSSVVPALTSGVKYVSFTGTALAVLKTDGTVRAWGHASYGGDSSAVSGALTNIAKLYSNRFAFAALTAAGGVVAWGDEENGGLIPSSLASVLSSGVTAIFSTQRAFAALKGATGQLVLWGNPFHGGSAGAAVDYLNSGVRTVCANDAAFTAILQDGRAVAWGHPSSIPTPGLLQSSPSFASVNTCATGALRAGL